MAHQVLKNFSTSTHFDLLRIQNYSCVRCRSSRKIKTFTWHTWGIWHANAAKGGEIWQRCSKFIGWCIWHCIGRMVWGGGKMYLNFRVLLQWSREIFKGKPCRSVTLLHAAKITFPININVYSVSDFFKHLKGHLIAQYVWHLITILGPWDECTSGSGVKLFLSFTLFFRIIFEALLGVV